MAFTRPTLTELVSRIEQDFVSRLSLTSALLRRSVIYIMARVIAGAVHMLHGHLDWISRQLLPTTCDRDKLIQWGQLLGVEINEATFATAAITITGLNGSVIPEETIFVRDDGARYEIDSEVTISGSSESGNVTALEAGADGTLTAGVVLTLESPIDDVESEAEVDSSTVDGTDEEETEDYRTRILDRMGQAPQGGSEADYVAWAKEVAGVTRAWVSTDLGPGTVLLRAVRDNDASIIPDAGEIAEIQAYIDELRPVTADVTVAAPTSVSRNFTLTTLTPNTTAVQDAVEAELEDLITSTAEPGGTLLLSAIRTAIGNAAGVTDYVLSSPAADVTHSTGEIPILGTVTFP